jgi:hypothetical protein
MPSSQKRFTEDTNKTKDTRIFITKDLKQKNDKHKNNLKSFKMQSFTGC